MTPFSRILVGLAVTALGTLLVYKTGWILSLVGRIAFAEKMFGGGGTRLFYKLLGILIIIIGFLFVTNLFDLIVGGFFIRIFGG